MAKAVNCPYAGCPYTATDAASMRVHIIQTHSVKRKGK